MKPAGIQVIAADRIDPARGVRGVPRAQVQIDSPVTRKGRLAQLARASVLHTEGQRFESSTAHQFPQYC